MRADIKRRTDVKTNLMEREEPCYCCVESQTRPIPALAGTTQSKSKQDVIIINLLSDTGIDASRDSSEQMELELGIDTGAIN